MKTITLALALTVGLAAAAAPSSSSGSAARPPVVLELFTSEGCSSCPPADRLIATLDHEQPFSNVDLIVLSEHVDYWNEGGWADPYSSPLFSARQRRYAEKFNLDSVYTPQRVVDGQWEGVGGSAPGARLDVEKAARLEKVPLMLSDIQHDGGQLKFHINSGALAAGQGEAKLYVALAEDEVRSNVRRGENAGRSLTHVAVVRSLTPVASVKTDSAFSKDVTLNIPDAAGSFSKGMRLVAFLQVEKTQQIVGAAESRLEVARTNSNRFAHGSDSAVSH